MKKVLLSAVAALSIATTAFAAVEASKVADGKEAAKPAEEQEDVNAPKDAAKKN